MAYLSHKLNRMKSNRSFFGKTAPRVVRGIQMAGLVAMVGLLTAAAPVRHQEIRAIWVTRWDYRAPSDVRAIVANCARIGMTDLFFQVRGNATVFYPSRVEPWGFELTGRDPSTTGQNPGWDPLQTAIDEARRHGIRVHAWINVLPGWRGRQDPPRAAGQLTTARPDWFMVDSTGRRMQAPDGWYSFLNPSHPEVRRHLVQLVEELSRYDLDGLHLDYIRFPYDYRDVARAFFPGATPEQLQAHADFSYDRISVAAARERFGPQVTRSQWDQFRRDAVTQVVDDLHRAFKARRGAQALFSASVLADFEEGWRRAFQESREWTLTRRIDWVVPMNYTAPRFDQRLDAIRHDVGRRATAGQLVVGIDCKEDPDEILRQIRLVRESGCAGFALFAYSHLFTQHQPTPKGRVLMQSPFFLAP